MSQASRLAAAETRFVKRLHQPKDDNGKFRPVAELARNTANVPGGLGLQLPGPITVCGMEWVPADGEPWGCPISAALAVEMLSGGS